ncbi:hypothetical protein [Roseovarius sp.]|uniref:hypothetical protein n=1 Tax=Roseovarius sp. TaxID=1486281 RepID=UPI002626B996|nr:hypothetical protein [Roseovarius sp.]MDM8165010.1 hypothetical protein [Roseovarius sp.]
MHAIADTKSLVADGVIDAGQARVIEARARETMVALAINSILCFGIVAATAGLIFWLANAVSVAIFGALALAGGLAVLARGGEMYRMFGNAAALIGAGMLVGGGVFELIDKHEASAGWVMLFAGVIVAMAGAVALWRGAWTTHFVTGAIFLMGVALHLGGCALLMLQYKVSGVPVAAMYFYASLLIAGAGMLTDVRLVTALAIAPFAQMLDTGTAYFHAAYVFYSPEPTLTILQMGVMVLLLIWAKNVWPERWARHARVLSVLGFIVASLCALVGSLWGDVVGETMLGPGRFSDPDQTWEEFEAQREAFRESTLVISHHVYSVVWAVVLAAVIYIAAMRANRGIFNAAMTFAGIHAYTQLFESFGDEPLAYVIGGLAAIPLAWGMWRLNGWITARQE